MGIKGLNKFLETYASGSIKEINTSALTNKVVAIDASIFIYQLFVKKIGVLNIKRCNIFLSHFPFWSVY